MQTTLRAGGLTVIRIYFQQACCMQRSCVLFNFKRKETKEILYWQDQNSKSAIECDHLDLYWIIHCQALYMCALAM